MSTIQRAPQYLLYPSLLTLVQGIPASHHLLLSTSHKYTARGHSSDRVHPYPKDTTQFHLPTTLFAPYRHVPSNTCLLAFTLPGLTRLTTLRLLLYSQALRKLTYATTSRHPFLAPIHNHTANSIPALRLEVSSERKPLPPAILRHWHCLYR